MEAHARSFSFIENEDLVKIPFFQREYVWERENWEELLQNMLDLDRSTFLGSIILKQTKRSIGTHKEVSVIDGQQRLTTLSLLFKAILDSFPPEMQARCEDSKNSILFYKRQRTEAERFVKIQHSRVDAESFKTIITSSGKDLDCGELEKSKSRIEQAYAFFRNALETVQLQHRERLFNRMLHEESKFLVIIELQDNENEQAIFDTINNSGVRLSAADSIKNAIFQRGNELIDKESDVVALYQEFWEKKFSEDIASLQFWSEEQTAGRMRRDNAEILLHSVAVIERFFDPEKHSLPELTSLYKKHLATLNKGALIAFVKAISDYADIYRSQVEGYFASKFFSFSDDTARLLHILDRAEVSTFHPYILHLCYQYRKNAGDLIPRLRSLEKFVMRRMLARQETKNYNKLCTEFIKDENAVNRRLQDTTDLDVLSGLQGISNKNASLVLFWIELHRRHCDPNQSVRALAYAYSLEHVLPQKWNEFWSTVPVKDSNGLVIADKDLATQERNAKCNWLGNMTLLNKYLNTSLRNYCFEKKVRGEGNKKGMKDYADLSITYGDIIKVFDNGDKVWDEAKIATRTNRLWQECIAIW